MSEISEQSNNENGLLGRAKAHHNPVLISQGNIIGIKYVIDSFEIHHDQPRRLPPEIVLKYDKILKEDFYKINVYCGRHGSKDIAKNFINICGGSKHVYCPSGTWTDSVPEKLNFFFAIEITFSNMKQPVPIPPKKVYLAQGHQLISNNWWIGGESVIAGSQKDPYALLLVTGDLALKIDGAYNKLFDISQISFDSIIE